MAFLNNASTDCHPPTFPHFFFWGRGADGDVFQFSFIITVVVVGVLLLFFVKLFVLKAVSQ